MTQSDPGSPTVTIQDAPAAAPAPQAAPPPQDPKTIIVTDALGRRITVRKLNALARMDMIVAAGAEIASNDLAMTYATYAAAVRDIDGEPFGVPTSYAEIRAMIGRLDDEGLEAVQEGFFQKAWAQRAGAPPAATQDSLKNS